MAKNLKKTNRQQFERIGFLMGRHPDVARGKGHFGSSKQLTHELWEKFAVELNSIGPPSRSSQEWQRVWIHYKANLKRKMANNKKNISATGGGPSEEISLSPLEESVANLLKLSQTLLPPGRTFTNMNVEKSLATVDNDENIENDFNLVEDTPEDISSHSTKQSSSLPIRKEKKTKSIEEERLIAIKTQTDNQTQILKTLQVIENTSYECYEIQKKTYDLKKKKIALLEKQIAQSNQFHHINMEYTKRRLELLPEYLTDF